MTKYIGAHVSASGGLGNAILNAEAELAVILSGGDKLMGIGVNTGLHPEQNPNLLTFFFHPQVYYQKLKILKEHCLFRLIMS